MSVLDELLADAQPGYEPQVAVLLDRIRSHLGEAAFTGVEKAVVVDHVIGSLTASPAPAEVKLQLISDISTISWWCGLELSDEGAAGLSNLARKIFFHEAKAIPHRIQSPDPGAMQAHALFVGPLVNSLHSPTRGAFDYIRAVASDPENRIVDVFHGGVFDADLQAYGAERLGALTSKVRFFNVETDPNLLSKAVAEGPRTFHIWCERAFSIHVSVLALFGPTVMFTCGDSAPVQFADAYWYCHEPQYIESLWRRRAAPAPFIANYLQLESAAFNRSTPARHRTRAELGFGADETVIVTAGNRLAVDMTQEFVDGLARLVLSDPSLRWVMVGRMPDYWVSALGSVLGGQFSHVEFDPDLASLLQATDLFANPFRAGGGNTAIMAIDAGAVVLTRGDLGDVGAFVPASHRTPDAESYMATLQALASDPAMRGVWLSEQRALLARRLDQDLFAEELKALCRLAYKRFAARIPVTLETVFAQPPPKRLALKGGGARRGRLR